MSNRVQYRRDTKARWAEVNPILMEGEVGLEIDTKNIKMGDGVHAWNELEYGVGIENITSELGDSENLAASQKLVTNKFNYLADNSAKRLMQGYASPVTNHINKGGNYGIYALELDITNPIDLDISVSKDVANTQYISYLAFATCNIEEISYETPIMKLSSNDGKYVSHLDWFETFFPYLLSNKIKKVTLIITSSTVPFVNITPLSINGVIFNNLYVGIDNHIVKSLKPERFYSVLFTLDFTGNLIVYNVLNSPYIQGLCYLDSEFNVIQRIEDYQKINKDTFPDNAKYVIATFYNQQDYRKFSAIVEDDDYNSISTAYPMSEIYYNKQKNLVKTIYGAFINSQGFYLNKKINYNTLIYKLDKEFDIYIRNTILSNQYIIPIVFLSDVNTVIEKVYVKNVDDSRIFVKRDIFPEEANFFAVTIDAAQNDFLVLNDDTTIILYKQESVYFKNNRDNEKKIITVKQDGSKQFKSLTEALESINDNSKYNQYDIYIYEGEYDVFSERDSLNLKRRYFLPNYVNLIGIGDKTKIIISGVQEHSDNVDLTEVSVLDVVYNNRIENLTMIGDNVRYVVHSDYYVNQGEQKIEVKNCIFYHMGLFNKSTNNSPQCWGCGSYNNKQMRFENCEFKSVNGIAWLSHNRWLNDADNITGCYLSFYNCKFTNIIDASIPNFDRVNWILHNAFGLQSWGSSLHENVEIVGCSSNLPMVLIDISTYSSNGTGLDYSISGHSNILPIVYSKDNGDTDQKRDYYCARFTDEGCYLRNISNIKIEVGYAVKVNENMEIVGLANNLDETFGFAYEVVDGGHEGFVKFRGYIHAKDLGLKQINVGEKISVSSGRAVIENDGILCKRKDFIFLKL